MLIAMIFTVVGSAMADLKEVILDGRRTNLIQWISID